METMPADLRGWLNDATRGLSGDVREDAISELLDHYECALADALDEGLSHEDAHRTVMDSLGAAKQTARGLRITHRADQHYRWAGVFSLCAPLILLLTLRYTLPYKRGLLAGGMILIGLYTVFALRKLWHSQIGFSSHFSRLSQPLTVTAGILFLLGLSVEINNLKGIGDLSGINLTPILIILVMLLGGNLVFVGMQVLSLRRSFEQVTASIGPIHVLLGIILFSGGITQALGMESGVQRAFYLALMVLVPYSVLLARMFFRTAGGFRLVAPT